MTTTTDSAAPAAPETASATAPTAPTTQAGMVPATGRAGTFVSDALKMLSGAATEQEPEPEAASPAAAEAAPRLDAAAAPDTKPATESAEDAEAAADIERETKTMPAAQKAAFTKLRYKLRDVQRQLRSAAEAPPAVEPDPAVVAPEVEKLRSEYEATKARLSEYEKEVFATRLELTDEFRAQITEPRARIAEEISGIVQRYDSVDEAAVIAAVQTGDAQRVSRVTADMAEFDRHTFYQLVRDYQGVNRQEAGLRENSRESLERIGTERRARDEARAAAEKTEWEKSLGSAWSDLVETFPVLEPVDGDAAWNSKIEAVKGFATPDRFTKLTTREKAEALHRAAAFPVLAAELETALAEVKEMQDRLRRYDAASPGVGSSGGSGGGTSIPATGDFVSKALAALRQVGSR